MRRPARQRLAFPARRERQGSRRLCLPQPFLKVLAEVLQGRLTAEHRHVPALEAENQAGMEQFEQEVMGRGIFPGAIELVEKFPAAIAFPEEAGQKAGLLRRVVVAAGKVGENLVGRHAEDERHRAHVGGGGLGGLQLPRASFDSGGDLRHERRIRRAQERGAQAAEQEQERRGCAQERVRVGGLEPRALDCRLPRRRGASGLGSPGRRRAPRPAKASRGPDDGSIVHRLRGVGLRGVEAGAQCRIAAAGPRRRLEQCAVFLLLDARTRVLLAHAFVPGVVLGWGRLGATAR